MSTWVVGDVQGCLQPLSNLLERVNFDWEKDWLWSTGDIVNRGPDCLGTLRFFYAHRSRIRLVLGNHDLHLLAVAAGARKPGRSDTLGAILDAPDRSELLAWLQLQPLLHREHGFTLVHAGIAPPWSIDEAADRAQEVENTLRGPDSRAFFDAMYGNEPDLWCDELQGMARLRVITNYFTRMRFCTAEGRLDLSSKGPITAPGGAAATNEALKPWFFHEHRRAANDKILFGHWAALEGVTGDPNALALDTGCVWGNAMTLYCLETGERVRETCAH